MNEEIKYSTNHTSISTNIYTDRNFKLDLGELVYHKTFEEEMEEQRKVSIAEAYLESLGVKVKTEMYDYYRNTYDILLDLGEYLDKEDKNFQEIVDKFCDTPLENPISPENLRKVLKISEKNTHYQNEV